MRGWQPPEQPAFRLGSWAGVLPCSCALVQRPACTSLTVHVAPHTHSCPQLFQRHRALLPDQHAAVAGQGRARRTREQACGACVPHTLPLPALRRALPSDARRLPAAPPLALRVPPFPQPDRLLVWDQPWRVRARHHWPVALICLGLWTEAIMSLTGRVRAPR